MSKLKDILTKALEHRLAEARKEYGEMEAELRTLEQLSEDDLLEICNAAYHLPDDDDDDGDE